LRCDCDRLPSTALPADPAKGQVYGGECNRTACKRHGATWWNLGTFGLYGAVDAYHINLAAPPSRMPLCIHVDAKPAIAEMEPLRRQRGYYD